MNMVVRLLVVTVGWCLLMGSFTTGQVVLGLLLSVLTLVLSAPVSSTGSVRIRPVALLGFVCYMLYDLCLSSVRVAVDALTPRSRSRSRIIAVPVEALDDLQVTVLANSITLTPGSLTLDVSDDGNKIYVHDMYADDADQARESISGDLQAWVRSAFPDQEVAS